MGKKTKTTKTDKADDRPGDSPHPRKAAEHVAEGGKTFQRKGTEVAK